MGDEIVWLDAVVAKTAPAQLCEILLCAAAIAYLLLALWRVTNYRKTAADAPSILPAVSVLKPICGAEPELYRCLRSFCEQDYPELQLVFGVAAADDPAIAVVERLIEEFPGRDIALVVDPRAHGSNLKVSNLINMYRVAKHEVLVISDSDTLVRADCVRRLMAPLAEPATGRWPRPRTVRTPPPSPSATPPTTWRRPS